jgi:hypothetical protein
MNNQTKNTQETFEMKKSALFLFISLFLFTFSACQNNVTTDNMTSSAESVTDTNIMGSTESTADTNIPESLSVSDFFPIRQDVKYIYSGEGNEYSSYTVIIDYTSDNAVQQRIDNGGTVVAKVITQAHGKLTITYLSSEAYSRENYLNKSNNNEVILMEPITVGTTWTLEDNSVRTITNLSASITTPLGDFIAIEVTTKSQDSGSITTDYYAKGIGLIKNVYNSDEVTSTLSKIEENTPFTQTVRFYYPNLDAGKIYYLERELVFNTNDITGNILAASYKEIPAGVEKVFSENTAINRLSVSDDGIVLLDLNQSFLTEMNAGSAYESMILNCIANTFSGYYQTDKVKLTFDGALYSSGHFAFGEDEFLKSKADEAVLLE